MTRLGKMTRPPKISLPLLFCGGGPTSAGSGPWWGQTRLAKEWRKLGQSQATALNPGSIQKGGFEIWTRILCFSSKKLHIYKAVGATKERPDCCEETCPRLFRRVLLNSGRAGISSLEEELESSEQ